jgi:protein-S-isoprenylcysteine O-methyltransferase Ste14
MDGTADRGSLPFHPPILYVAAFLLGLVVEHLSPTTLLRHSWADGLGGGLIVLGMGMVGWTLLCFYKARTAFDLRRPATTLITGGPFRISRHPAYLGLTAVYVGVGFIVGNLWVLLFVVPVVVIMDRWVLPKEERHLEQRFGEDCVRYRATVRRWF